MRTILVIFAVLAVFSSTNAQQRCGITRPPCGDDECCALLPLVGRQCKKLGTEGQSCGIGLYTCPCRPGLPCINFRCTLPPTESNCVEQGEVCQPGTDSCCPDLQCELKVSLGVELPIEVEANATYTCQPEKTSDKNSN